MPGWETTEQYHRHRLKDPDLFDKMRTKSITSGVSGIYGRLKSTGEWTWQNIMFDVDKFTLDEAKKWFSEHKDKFASVDTLDLYKSSTLNFAWSAPYSLKGMMQNDAFPHVKTILIEGVAIDDSVNKNNWQIEKPELEEVATQLKGKQIRINHSDRYEDVKGIVTDARVEDNKVMCEAEITAREDVLVPLLKGYARGLSLSAEASEIICGKCGKTKDYAMKDACPCRDTVDVLKGFEVRELSLVADPAYGNKTFATPVGFAASVEKELNNYRKTNVKIEEIKQTEDENMTTKKEEAKVEAIVATPAPIAAEDSINKRFAAIEAMMERLIKIEEDRKNTPAPAAVAAKEETHKGVAIVDATVDGTNVKVNKTLMQAAIEEINLAHAGKIPIGRMFKE